MKFQEIDTLIESRRQPQSHRSGSQEVRKVDASILPYEKGDCKSS